MAEALRAAQTEPSVRAVLITGQPGIFTCLIDKLRDTSVESCFDDCFTKFGVITDHII
jgi:hypothetical protein